MKLQPSRDNTNLQFGAPFTFYVWLDGTLTFLSASKYRNGSYSDQLWVGGSLIDGSHDAREYDGHEPNQCLKN